MKALYNEPQLDLRTAEGMEFTLPLAGPVSRMLALWIDMAVVMAAGTLIQKLMDMAAAYLISGSGHIHGQGFILNGFNGLESRPRSSRGSVSEQSASKAA